MATAFVIWTYVALFCAFIVVMSGAHSSSGRWPGGATVALVIVPLSWLLGLVIMWRRRPTSARRGTEPAGPGVADV
jgi:hypothetical protein